MDKHNNKATENRSAITLKKPPFIMSLMNFTTKVNEIEAYYQDILDKSEHKQYAVIKAPEGIEIDWSIEPEAREYGVKYFVTSIRNIKGKIGYKSGEQYIKDEMADLNEEDNLIYAPLLFDYLKDQVTLEIEGRTTVLDVKNNIEFSRDGGIEPACIEFDFRRKIVNITSNSTNEV